MLILCDVLRWRAEEAATLLDITVASTNGLLRRARKTLAGLTASDTSDPTLTPEQRGLLNRYVNAFERSDIDALTSLLHEDATLSMPPYPLWLLGRAEIERWFGRTPNPLPRCPHGHGRSQRAPAVAIYHATWPGEPYQAFGIQVLTMRGSAIIEVEIHLEPRMFPVFDLPAQLFA
ncbi:nuclear transport factor 2 family protein [Nocardia sp. NPDC052278]|uniref:nuclear transport factor 2 family protein n=1 Tax=unclassified Nocardia TaxID=2637762 RepID=UPI0036AAE2E8